MEKFIRIITDKPCNFSSSLCETIQILLTNDVLLEEKPFVIGLFESKRSVLHIPLKEHVPKHAADIYATCISTVLSENDIQDFDIEFSTGVATSYLNENSLLDEPEEITPEKHDIFTKTEYDVVSDIIVFMRNDSTFYKKYYYPALHRISQKYKKTGKIEFNSYMNSVIKQAIFTYCSVYNTPEEPNELFGKEEKTAIMDRIIKDEIAQIRNGEYS